ncbi:MAG TPA: hypothetical protein VMT52_15825 [Planctomycetota bacterium]|nr:hypothetical protein [Planctomycetota bacterium]
MQTMIQFRCYYCHRIHKVNERAAGRRGRCVCGKRLLVPEASGPGAGAGDLPLASPAVEDGSPASAPPSDAADLVLTTALPPIPGSSREMGAFAPRAPRPGPRSPRDSSREPAVRGVVEKKGFSNMSGRIFIALATIVLAAFIFHVGFTGLDSPSQVDPNYLTLPRDFWSSALVALCFGLLWEGICRLRNAE